jgi:hypothetical protein
MQKRPQGEASSMYVREKWRCVGVGKRRHVMVEIKLLCLSSSFLSLSMHRRGFQNLLKVGTSLFTLCGYLSSSMAPLMSRSLYPVSAERCFVSCNLIIWSWLMLCSANADLSVCASRVYLLCSMILIWINRPLSPI